MTTQTIERPVQRPPAADVEALFPGRYLSVTTFKRDGTPVATPVWAVSDGSRLYAFTDLHSAKIKRIRHNPHVLVASCWVNGKLRREPVSGRAGVLTEIADLERVRNLLLARYKISYRVVMLFYRLGRRLRGKQSVADGAALAITLDSRGESQVTTVSTNQTEEQVVRGNGPRHTRGQLARGLRDGVRRLGKTPPFRGLHGELVPGSIAEIAYQRLGGVAQWVLIRGESVANPPLILLHGGPGWSETGFLRYFNAPLEKSFTAVYWDQRGAGKSFDRNIPRSSMTVEQFISDLDELVDAVCQRLGRSKVAIFGHSWGSVLGVLYAARFPEKVEAYVGCAQVGDWATAEAGSYEWALAEAQRIGNRRAVRKLRAIGPPPYPVAAVFTERTLVSRFEGQMRPRAMLKVARAVLGSHESSILELPRTMRGFRWTMDAMWAEVSRLNLIEQVPALQVPVFFFLGRNDHWIPPETSVAYFEALTAPSKKLVWFEHSSHEMFVDEPDKFNAAMAELVRPALPSEESTPRT